MTVLPMQVRLALADEIDAIARIDHEAGSLFAQVGISLVMPDDHPFALAEREDWRRAARSSRLYIVDAADDRYAAFMVLDEVDGAPYLEQLSVRPLHMRKGIGSRLLEQAIAQSRSSGALWLMTYGHVPWNRPFYERAGFRVVPEAECGPELREIARLQRAALPDPEQRVAMKISL
jgi:GNAT superfamily N-acetyltransferase